MSSRDKDKDERRRAAAERDRLRREARDEVARRAAEREARIAAAFSRREDKPVVFDRMVREVLHRAPKLADPRYSYGLNFLSRSAWVRAPDGWRPRGKAPDTQFKSLARHLVAKYPVPEFLLSSFFEVDKGLRDAGIALFTHLGRGGSLFTATASGAERPILPVPLTRRMCRELTGTTAEYSLVSAVRRAQVIVNGGDRRLHAALGSTFLGRGFVAREDFWSSVIQWLCQQPMLSPAQVGPIVDWVNFRAGVDEARGVPFAMKGRTGVSVCREVERWHGELARGRKVDGKIYPTSGFVPSYGERRVRLPNGAVVVEPWCVIELICSADLLEEGKVLRHCVYTYSHWIERGRSSIWSLRIAGARTLTIEVDHASRRVVQVRGKSNRLAREDEMRLVRQWAATNGLDVGVRVWR